MPEKKNFVLRLNKATYSALEKWAADEFRSVNGQIEFILNAALREQFGKNYPDNFRRLALSKPPAKEAEQGRQTQTDTETRSDKEASSNSGDK